MQKLTDDSEMPFGVFHHMKMANVPARHLLWLYEQPWLHRSSNPKHRQVRAYIEENKAIIDKQAAEAQG